MSDVVTSAIIGAIATLIGAVIGWLGRTSITKKKGLKIKNSQLISPKIFPCASCNHELVMKLHNDCKTEFDFAPNQFRDSVPDFVSAVFEYPSVNIERKKAFRFELKFGNENINGIDFELHEINQIEQIIWKKYISHFIGWETITINLNEVDPKRILWNLSQICFVVRNTYFSQQTKMDGSFIVRNPEFID